ncbi:SDR family oxidoreductase [Ensifer soli]|uniref:SDR family oxidoreductase n=1 Tax=Ciceribacter sp. sgz301302 TaxID=3342379 RepID=UPI0035B7E543
MKTTGNTILITGGGSGIGRALAEALHRLGNQVIISGRRRAALDAVVAAHPGMAALTVDMTDPASIAAFAGRAVAEFPALNVVINNAGIMKPEDIGAAPDDLAIAEETIATNLLGPIRLTAALLPHLKGKDDAAILTVSSGLAFVPLAATPTYSATKAAIHSYSMSLRHRLKESGIEVIEIAPPYVQTELMGEAQASDPRAMPLADFIDEVVTLLGTQPTPAEIIVERCKPLRFAAENGTIAAVFDGLNTMHG